jgi:hypothetical protein
MILPRACWRLGPTSHKQYQQTHANMGSAVACGQWEVTDRLCGPWCEWDFHSDYIIPIVISSIHAIKRLKEIGERKILQQTEQTGKSHDSRENEELTFRSLSKHSITWVSATILASTTTEGTLQRSFWWWRPGLSPDTYHLCWPFFAALPEAHRTQCKVSNTICKSQRRYEEHRPRSWGLDGCVLNGEKEPLAWLYTDVTYIAWRASQGVWLQYNLYIYKTSLASTNS